MKPAILAALLLGACASVPESDHYCIGGYKHSYSAAGGYRQIWTEHGNGAPCETNETRHQSSNRNYK